jgi:hypothetical protein
VKEQTNKRLEALMIPSSVLVVCENSSQKEEHLIYLLLLVYYKGYNSGMVKWCIGCIFHNLLMIPSYLNIVISMGQKNISTKSFE